MSKKFIASVTLFSFLSLSSPILAAPQGQDSFSQVGVTVESSNGEIAQQGDTVKVGDNSQMTLRLPSGARVKVAPNSEFKIVNDSNGQANVYLMSGRVLTSAKGPVTVQTARSSAIARTGEFVVDANAEGTGLRVLSGDAQLQSESNEKVSFDGLKSLPNTITDHLAQAFKRLSANQTAGDFTFGAQGKGGKGKGQGVRAEDDEDATGGTGDVRPDTDVLPVGEQPVTPPPETTAPVTTTTPTTTTTAPTTTTTTTTTAGTTAAGGGAGFLVPALIGAGLITGAVLLATNDDDEEEIIVVPVPSPSLP